MPWLPAGRLPGAGGGDLVKLAAIAAILAVRALKAAPAAHAERERVAQNGSTPHRFAHEVTIQAAAMTVGQA
ncbi:hypothetical protein [Kitasatospora purpeofusca]|uniref:hypothetical protein n=1 Tax=Kitasatospora purpeofusca TaxID=67352 RepID=UPI002A59A12B|nr:hypothetical protein [Kitasatospora purpeofusca]MDY0812654.1 hypothetical protein [Kitasatospora purpeofusca]